MSEFRLCIESAVFLSLFIYGVDFGRYLFLGIAGHFLLHPVKSPVEVRMYEHVKASVKLLKYRVGVSSGYNAFSLLADIDNNVF